MSAEYNKTIARRWVKGFNNGLIREEMVPLYAPNATHYSPRLKIERPETGGFIQGEEAFVDWWESARKKNRDIRYIIEDILADKERVLMQYIRSVQGEADTQAVESFIIGKEDKLIHRSRVFLG